jgi:hypothetical protein
MTMHKLSINNNINIIANFRLGDYVHKQTYLLIVARVYKTQRLKYSFVCQINLDETQMKLNFK